MPDLACEYVLTTPGGTITFNDGAADQFYIQGLTGLGTAPARTPIDDVPYGNGGLGHNFWTSGRHVGFEGLFLVTSKKCPSPEVNEQWNVMEEDLRAALASICGLTSATGTLVWTPLGLPQRTLVVRHDVPMECPAGDSFMTRNFTFGLYSDASDWS